MKSFNELREDVKGLLFVLDSYDRMKQMILEQKETIDELREELRRERSRRYEEEEKE